MADTLKQKMRKFSITVSFTDGYVDVPYSDLKMPGTILANYVQWSGSGSYGIIFRDLGNSTMRIYAKTATGETANPSNMTITGYTIQ